MLDHNQLTDPTGLVIQKYKNEWFVLIIVAYNEGDDIIEIDEYHQRLNNEIQKNPYLFCCVKPVEV